MIDSPSPAPAGERHDLRRRLLIETKMNAPRLPSRCVSRRTQLDLLQQGLARKLTVLVAPAGFGKTTPPADWCRSPARNGDLGGWVGIDARDDDLAQRSGHMLGAIRRASTVAR